MAKLHDSDTFDAASLNSALSVPELNDLVAQDLAKECFTVDQLHHNSPDNGNREVSINEQHPTGGAYSNSYNGTAGTAFLGNTPALGGIGWRTLNPAGTPLESLLTVGTALDLDVTSGDRVGAVLIRWSATVKFTIAAAQAAIGLMAYNPDTGFNQIIEPTVGGAYVVNTVASNEVRMAGTWLITAANTEVTIGGVPQYAGVRLVISSNLGVTVTVLDANLSITPLHCGSL